LSKTDVVTLAVRPEAGEKFNLASLMRLFLGIVGDRREFIRAMARYALLSVLGAGGYLSARAGKLSGQTCVQQGICINCPRLADCGLPAALSRKRSGGGTKV
jgi:hypothetical protein